MINEVLADLKAYTPLTDIIGQRVYRGVIPGDPTYPLVFFGADQEVQNTLSGQSSLQKYNFVFEVHGSSYVQTKSIKANLIDALIAADNYKAINTEVADERYNDETDQYMLIMNISIWG